MLTAPTHPTHIGDKTFRYPNDLPKRPSAIHLINPADWKITRTTPLGSRRLPDDILGERFAPVSRESALTNLHEEVDRELREAQDNFATVFNLSPAILCIIQLDGLRYREINPAYEERTGYSRSEVLGKSSLKLGLWNNARDRDRIIRKLFTEGRVLDRQAVFRTKMGGRLTTFLSAEIIAFGGKQCALVIAEDVTMRRQSEEARVDLAQRLIDAQEAERRRIAQELHDNIGHSIAICGLELDKACRAFVDLGVDGNSQLNHLRGKLTDLGRVVGNLSYQLHSAHLELLGFVVAVKRLCREFAEQYLIPTQCNCSGDLNNLSGDIALCLFRVTQEALHNIAKHGHAKNVEVEVIGTPDKIYLKIADDGVGFTPNIKKYMHGLGLISMRERLYLIGGKFSIVAKPGSGTLVEATAPLHR